MDRRLAHLLLLSMLGCAAPALGAPATPTAEGSPSEPPADDAPAEPPKEDPPADPPPPEQPPAEQPPAEEPPPEDPPKEEPPKPAKPPTVTLSEPEFINGEVEVQKFLEKSLAEVATCVAESGGLEGTSGELKMQFLVRARGRAEGVEVLGRKGVAEDAGRCVQKILKNKWVGMPTQDPTGVVFRYELKAKPGSPK
ncbi:MAG: hypothetical protein KC731_17340 [Myxococcales bacterium]|nr:hypothetical protein [Myxococcales bacterium]